MYLLTKWKVWKRRVGAFVDQPRQRRRPQPRPALLLESLEDRMLLTAWTSIGPAPLFGGQTAGLMAVSGRVTGLAADPSNANTIYAATAGGGIWKTTNATTANPIWTPLTDNLTDNKGNPLPEFMGAIAETYATSGKYSGSQIVYGGTGEANNSLDSFYGEGILVSTNGGASWTLTTGPGDAFNRRTVSKIVIDPSDPTGGTAYAAVCGSGTNGLGGNTGIWKTTDFGKNWTNMTGNDGLSTTDAWSDVVIDPHTGNIYAAQGTSGGAAGNGVYESTDGGTDWNLLNGTGTYNGTQAGRIALALYDNGTTNELFVSIAKPKNGHIYKLLESTNGGTSFNDLTSNLPNNYLGDQGWYDTTLAIDPQHPKYIYVGGAMANQGPTFSGSPLESFDGGNTWTDLATDSNGNGPHSDDHAVVFDIQGNLIDGDDGGVFRLNNPTNSSTQYWTDLNTNLQITQFEGIGVDTTNGTVWGGSQDNSTEKYPGNPASGDLSWTEIPANYGDGGYTRVDPTNHDIVYQEYTGVAPRVSADGGVNFQQISNGIAYNTDSKGNPIAQFYTPYVLDSSGDIYYGTDYLNFSSNQGSTWTAIGTPGTNNFNEDDNAISAIAVSSTDNNVVYVATTGGDTFVTKNAQAGGNNVKWTQINLPGDAVVGGNYADSIAIDPADSTGGTAYAVVNAFSGGKHVFMTTNFGGKWTDISGDLPDTPVDSVTVSPDGKTVYVGTDVGVYSTSGVKGASTTWTRLGTGLPNAQVADMELVPSENLLVIATHGRGAWQISTATAPTVTTNPSNQTVTAGQTVTVTAAASGNPTPTVQWQVSTNGGSTWTNISGATGTTLTLPNVTQAMSGEQFQAVFTNSAGSAASSAAILTVQTPTVNPVPQPSPSQAPALTMPPLLSLINQFFKGVETVNPDGSVTVTYSLFGYTLLTATYNSSGTFQSGSIYGISIPNRMWFL